MKPENRIKLLNIIKRLLIFLGVTITIVSLHQWNDERIVADANFKWQKYWYDRLYEDNTNCGALCPTEKDLEYRRENFEEATADGNVARSKQYQWQWLWLLTIPILAFSWFSTLWIISGSIFLRKQ